MAFGPPNPNMVPNFSAGQYAPPTNTGIGSVTSGVTAGALPQSQLAQASQQMLAPAAWSGHFGGALGQQLNQLMGQQQQAGNVDMLRSAAPVQANLALNQQVQNANAGLQNASLLSRLQQDQFAAQQPYRNILFQMLGGGGVF